MDKEKIILDLCGGIGAWSNPYKDAGYDVRIIDPMQDTGDVRLFIPPDNVHGVLAAPPCDQFSKAKHFHGKGNYSHDFLEGLSIVDACHRIAVVAKPKWWVLENPDGYLTRWLKKPPHIFNPWEYGDNYQKRTFLWGEFCMPKPLVTDKPDGMMKFSMLKSKEIRPEYYGIYNRKTRRAMTPKGFAQAFFKANP